MWIQRVLTLNGSRQQLSSVLPDPSTQGDDIPLRTVTLQGGESNANPVYIGNAEVTTALWAIRLPAASAGVPGAPFIIGEHEHGPLRLSDFHVQGTNGETLHIGYVPY